MTELERLIAEANFTWENIPGWFTFQGLYDMVFDRAQDGARFVELGCYLGRSAVYMADKIKKSGKKIAFDIVDNYTFNVTEKQTRTMLKLCRVDDVVNLIAADFHAVIPSYVDKSLDFAFVDADHSYEGTRDAIELLKPKMKSGGIIGGDDYEFRGNFPGVRTAVRECLPGFKLIDRAAYYWNVP